MWGSGLPRMQAAFISMEQLLMNYQVLDVDIHRFDVDIESLCLTTFNNGFLPDEELWDT